MKSIYGHIESFRNEGIRTALCSIIDTKGSTPLKKGAKMLVVSENEKYGTIGGGYLEKAVVNDALKQLESDDCKIYEHNLLQRHGMCCGGTVTLLIETIMPKDRLYIFGSGHVGRSLAFFADQLEFEVFVIDPRIEELDKLDVNITNRLNLPYQTILSKLPFGSNVYIAVMTYDHQTDREIVAYCLNRDRAYLGMIGSKRKVAVTRKMFLSTNLFDEKSISKIDMPMGFDVKGKTPNEIAIGILAKMIQLKNNTGLIVKVNTDSEHTIEYLLQE